MHVLKQYHPDSRHLKGLAKIVGEKNVSISDPVRIEYSRDCHAINILYVCEGRVHHPPDFVVWPKDLDQVRKLVSYAGMNHIPVIPFGAGSGVCRGTEPIRGGLIIDLKRMNRILAIDDESLLVHVQAGMMGQNYELELNRHGYTGGHFPSSIYCSTVGGWVACRAAGQLSTKYGKIEDLIHNMTVVLPDGEVLVTPDAPRMAVGPDFNQVFTGSEGTLGIIVDVQLRIFPEPEERLFLSFNFPDSRAGTEAIRRILQKDIYPAAVRLYDELDTVMVGRSGKGGGGLLDMAPVGEFAKLVRGAIPGLRKSASRLLMSRASLVNQIPKLVNDGCLLVLTFEGSAELTRLEAQIASAVCEASDGKALGPDPARHWWENRYHVSYKMSKIFDAGAFVDTMEVAVTWDKLMELYQTVKKGISSMAFIMAHFSHAYPDGCSIYFTFVSSAADADAARDLHHRIWSVTMDACEQLGATISHHHGVGLLKASWMPQELGQSMPVHKALKEVIDPDGIMNPGKLGH